MNAKTAKLINKYSAMFNESAKELKRLWNKQNYKERDLTRATLEREMESKFYLDNNKTV